MNPIELKIAQMLASLLEEITLGTSQVLSSSVKIKELINRGYEVIWEGIVYIGYGCDEVIDASEIDLGISQICHEVLEGQIEWNTDQNFNELNNIFTQNFFEKNWKYDTIPITDERMNPKIVKNVLDIVGTEKIGSALLEFYGSEALVPFEKYPDFLADSLKECVREETFRIDSEQN
jgi:hypothetical protein